MSRVTELEAELVVAKEEERLAEAKAKLADSKMTAKDLAAYREATAAVNRARTRHRVLLGRKGSESFKVTDDGEVVRLKSRVKATNVRDPKDNRIVDRTVEPYVSEEPI